MFDYTKAILNKTERDLDIFLTVVGFGTQILYIAYLVYSIFSISNIWYLYLALLIVSAVFLVFDIITTKSISEAKNERFSVFSKKKHKRKISEAKSKRRRIKKIKFYISHSLKLFVLAASFYTVIVSPDTLHPLSIMCTTVMVLMWILNVILEVLRLIFNNRVDLFTEALNADVEFVTKRIDSVKNTFKKLIRQEVEEQTVTKERTYLDDLVEKYRDAKAKDKSDTIAERTKKIAQWFETHITKNKDGKNDDDESVTVSTEQNEE